MQIGYVQYNVRRSPEENLRQIERSIARQPGSLFVLPELCTCGYLFKNRAELQKAAETVPEGTTTQRMLQISKEYACTIVFGLAEAANGNIYNTAAVVSHGTYIGRYRKIHLTDFEKRLFTRGRENPVFRVGGITIGVQICFDLWFPEVSREQLRQGAQLLCTPANFGGETTCTIAQVRAIENQTPLVMCNRVGREAIPELDASFLGRSAVVDASGFPLLRAKDREEETAVCEVDIGLPRANMICGDFDAEIALHMP